jgi:hypothetical protein
MNTPYLRVGDRNIVDPVSYSNEQFIVAHGLPSAGSLVVSARGAVAFLFELAVLLATLNSWE